MKNLLLLILLFSSFSFSATEDDYNNCYCSKSWVFDITVIGQSQTPKSNDDVAPVYSCTSNLVRSIGTWVYQSYLTDEVAYYTIDYTKQKCLPDPCDPETEILIDGYCEEIPPPDCSENYSYDNNLSKCVADNPDDIDDDGIPNWEDPDIDGDGSPNWEDPDMDGDGTPNETDNTPGGSSSGGGESEDDPIDPDDPATKNSECGSGAVYSIGEEQCVCLDGGEYPNCGVTECPISYGGLTLQMQNVSNSVCISSFPPSNGWEVNYLQDGTLSCCFASKNNTPDPCDPNEYRDNEGNCQTIPTADPSCGANEYLDSSVSPPKCRPIPCQDGSIRDQDGNCQPTMIDPTDCLDGFSWDNFSQECKRDSTAGDGTDLDSEDDLGVKDLNSSYDSLTDTVEEKIMMQFEDDKVTEATDEYSTGISEQFQEFIAKLTPDLTTLFDISVPVTASCGCENPVINYKGYSETVEICKPLDTIFGVIRPLLWFGFLLSILFGFLRGGTN